MARIFTIQFSYNDETYNTVVSVKTTPLFIEYTLHNLDFDILTRLPGNKIVSPSPKQFLFPNTGAQHSKELMNAIIKSMMVHLQAVNF